MREGVSKYYPYMLTIAGMFFLSIMVMFWSLHLDMRYTRLERDVQKLRERSIRLQEQRYQRTTHSAIVGASSFTTRRRRARSSKTKRR